MPVENYLAINKNIKTCDIFKDLWSKFVDAGPNLSITKYTGNRSIS